MTTALIPAAGRGSRLGADQPKALVNLGDRALLAYVLDAVVPVVDSIVVVIAPATERLFEEEVRRSGWSGPLALVVQSEPVGSADAVARGLGVPPSEEDCVVVWGDQVGVSGETVARVARCLGDFGGLVLPLASVPSPYVWYEVDGRRVRVGRQRDGDTAPALGTSDVGVFGVRAHHALACLGGQGAHEPKEAREADFVYVVPRIAERYGLHVLEVDDVAQTIAVNDRDDLARASLHFTGART